MKNREKFLELYFQLCEEEGYYIDTVAVDTSGYHDYQDVLVVWPLEDGFEASKVEIMKYLGH